MRTYFKIIGLASLLCSSACESSIDVNIPAGVYDAEMVFESEETTEAALRGIYQSMTTGGFSGKTNPFVVVLGGLGGLTSDELVHASPSSDQQLYLTNNLNATSSSNAGIWASFYSYLYQCNRFIEGVNNSTKIKDPARSRFLGEAYFVRAISFFYLTNLYKNIPMPLRSEYTENSQLAATAQAEVYTQVIADLTYAISVMDPAVPAVGKRYRASYWAAKALLARVYLYQQQWQLAEQQASDVIGSGGFELGILRSTFLETSKEAIWQLANPGANLYSVEASSMSGNSANFSNSSYRLSPFLISQFSTADQRLALWTKLGTGTAAGTRAPRKLWVTGNTEANAVKEATTPIRLAEVYLIRAEARAQQNNLEGAIADIDKIRTRAGASTDPMAEFKTLAVANPDIQKAELIAFIYAERLRELFSEQGHRWFDAKRSGIPLKDFFEQRKPDIEATDAYFPINQNDLLINNKLTQNDGY